MVWHGPVFYHGLVGRDGMGRSAQKVRRWRAQHSTASSSSVKQRTITNAPHSRRLSCVISVHSRERNIYPGIQGWRGAEWRGEERGEGAGAPRGSGRVPGARDGGAGGAWARHDG